MSFFLIKQYLSRFFSRKLTGKINIFISSASRRGGGSNTFTGNFEKWISFNESKYHQVFKIQQADVAIIIANRATHNELKNAKNSGCFIIHRLDEHIDKNNSPSRKHVELIELNKFADVTVYQSEFVYNNMHSFLNEPDNFAVIHNGTFHDAFYPAGHSGMYVGHVTWGVGAKKRLDLVLETIKKFPEEKFLLVGNHSDSEYDFGVLPNAVKVGAITRDKILKSYHQMKCLYFPSENDPCPNTVVESISSGVPVCYNPLGGSVELVKDCGLPLDDFVQMLKKLPELREKCLERRDLDFNKVAEKYLVLYSHENAQKSQKGLTGVNK